MLAELREQVCEANLELKRSVLVVLTWGNVSARDPATGLVVIKPSGISYDGMRPSDMVVVDAEGNTAEGRYRPSSDTATHLVLYQAFPQIGGIAHTHSPHATAWAQARRPIRCLGTTHADTFHGTIPVTGELSDEQVAGDYETETGHAIVRAMAGIDPLDMPAVLVASHGPFVWAGSALGAAEASVALEEVARMASLTEGLSDTPSPISASLLGRHFRRKHGPGAYYGQQGD